MQASKPTPRPPNLVVIMADEHDPAVSGCYGDRIVDTPNLDRLAREGVTFDACYTTSPLCVPARLSFTAGKYVSRCGAWSNNCRLPSDDIPSLPRVLRAAGYESFLCGKQHYDRNHRYGFTDILPESGKNFGAMNGRGVRRVAADERSNVESWKGRSGGFRVGEDSPVMRHDRMVTRRAVEFLENWRADFPPFFLLVGHLAPHFPLIVPQAYADKYRGRVPMPNLPEGLLAGQPRNYHHLRRGFGVTDPDPEIVRRGRELYWALVDWYDGQIGQVLDAVRRSPVGADTVVIYTADHGENKGDHGLWWKNNFYEHAGRIPLIASWPQRWPGGQRRAGACSLVDLVQTLTDLAGVRPPADWDGDSLLPWLDNPAAAWKDLAVSEYYAHNIASGMAMIRKGAWKYIYHTTADESAGPERELYHLPDDPAEFRNLAADPAQAGRLRELHAALVAELGAEPDDTERRCREDYARGYA
jgi:choline-sulfatase